MIYKKDTNDTEKEQKIGIKYLIHTIVLSKWRLIKSKIGNWKPVKQIRSK
jgi:hypothetical protein